jgi:hypothetical protein
MHVGSGDQYCQRQPGPVTHDVDLRAGLTAVDRVRAGIVPIFVARTAIESTIARDQSISLLTFNRFRNT